MTNMSSNDIAQAWRLLSLSEQDDASLPKHSDYDLDKLKRTPQPLVPAAVLIGLLQRDAEYSILLTKRTNNLNQHKGQIAFPGGKIDVTDTSPLNAALREANEEVGLETNKITPLGRLPSYQTVTGFCITPIVANLEPPYKFYAEPSEVEEIFELPLNHIIEVENFKKHSLLYEGQKRHYWAVPYNGYYIWGATAAILRELAQRVQPSSLWGTS